VEIKIIKCFTYTCFLLKEQKDSFAQIYKGAGVRSCKKTHERTNAIQYGGSRGLAPHQINTFTNHMLDKLNSAYQSEADFEVRTFATERDLIVP
jgi:hypothetical protein